jgi:hypothetical protein
MQRSPFIALILAALASLGCAAAPDDVAGNNTAGSGSSAGSGSTSSGGAGGLGSGGSGSGWASGGGSGGTTTIDAGTGTGGAAAGTETECDGLDNNQNGIIDDVDKGDDGICDCLKIATLGIKGKYGQGDVFANWLATRSDFGAVPLANQVITDALIAPYDVIVAQDLSTKGGVLGGKGYTAAEAASMQAWLTAGGGLMTMVGYEDEYSVNNVNQLLLPLGLSYGNNKILYDAAVAGWLIHPVTDGVSLIHIGNGYPVQGIGTVIATESGHNVLQHHDVGAGRVLMWADEWITYDSEWVGNPQYQVELFWVNIIKYLSPPDICQVPIPPSIK